MCGGLNRAVCLYHAASGERVGSFEGLSHVASRIAVLRGRDDRPCTIVCGVGRGRIAFMDRLTVCEH